MYMMGHVPIYPTGRVSWDYLMLEALWTLLAHTIFDRIYIDILV